MKKDLLSIDDLSADEIYRVLDTAEAIEAIVHGDPRISQVVGRTIEQVPLPPGASIGAVVRGEEVLMAHHDICLEEGDHVILFITDSRHVEAVEKLFQAPPSFL